MSLHHHAVSFAERAHAQRAQVERRRRDGLLDAFECPVRIRRSFRFVSFCLSIDRSFGSLDASRFCWCFVLSELGLRAVDHSVDVLGSLRLGDSGTIVTLVCWRGLNALLARLVAQTIGITALCAAGICQGPLSKSNEYRHSCSICY